MKKDLIAYRAVGYIRESTRVQTVRGYRAGFQKDEIERYCKKHGFSLVKVFEDSGSGKNVKKRPNFQLMISFAKENRIDFIVVEDANRFYRNVKAGMTLEEELFEKHGIIVIDAEDYNPRDYKDSGISPQAWRQRAHRRVDAEGESRDISSRVTEGIAEKKDNRLYVGPLAYGVEWVDPNFPKYIRYKEPESTIVKEIFKLCCAGQSARDIVKEFLARGLKVEETVTKELKQKSGKPYRKKVTTHRDFTYDIVLSILRNKTYIGRQNTGQPLRLLTINAKEEEVDIEPLIDEDTFNRAHEKMQERGSVKQRRAKNSRQKDERVYLFQGMIRHAECGYLMHGVPEKLRNGEFTRRYQCSGPRDGKCNAKVKSLRADEVEGQIVELLREIKLKNEQQIETELRDIIKLSAVQMSMPQTLENLTLAQRDEIKLLKANLDNGHDWLLTEQKAKMEKRLKELKAVAASKTAEMLKYYDFQELRQVLADIATSFSEMQNLAARQELLSLLFQEVLVGKPMPEEPHEYNKYLHWSEHLIEDYQKHKDARRLKVLLRQFIPMLFSEIHVGQDTQAFIKKVTFKPTGLFLLMTDGVKHSKKKS